MKFNLSFMYLSVLIFCSTVLKGQVTSQYISKSSNVVEIIAHDLNYNTKEHELPKINFANILAKDNLQDSRKNRIAVKSNTSFNKLNGDVLFLDDTVIWTLDVKSQDARFLIYKFTETYLPPSARMFIYSPEKEFLQGPITSSNITDGLYVSDIIDGNQSQILIKLTKEDFDKLRINIPTISQGIPEAVFRGFGSAGSCHFDVNCGLGSGYEKEADAVGFMIEDMENYCSGSLINNECSDLTPYFLTALHCIDDPSDLDISTSIFRFNYEASTPTCPGNSTGTQGDWITFSGAIERASHSDTDFALLELNGSLLNLPYYQKANIALAGWNRSTTPATSGVGIHHPKGDAKKVSSFTDDAESYDLGDWDTDAIYHWWITLNQGKLDEGSSGSPVFDQNKRIIGQLDKSGAKCGIASNLAWYGRLNKSWTGGGSNSTRLSNWLGDSNPAMTVNSIRIPYINAVGVGPLCTTNKNITLINPIPGRSISWLVAPTSLFATTSGASTSGNTSSATIRAKNSSSSGSATIQYTLSKSGCDPVVLTENFWVGPPNTLPSPPLFINTPSYSEACIETTSTLITGPASSGYIWDFGAWGSYVTGYPEPGNKKVNFVIANYAPTSATIKVLNTNACGNGPQRIAYFNAIDCYAFLTVSPNPAINNVIISSKEPLKNTSNENKRGKKIYGVEIYDQFSRKRKSIKYSSGEEKVQVDISSFESGIYTFIVFDGKQRHSHKIIKQ